MKSVGEPVADLLDKRHEQSVSRSASENSGRWPRAKFSNPDVTATREQRAVVALRGLETLWFNTGTLCNLACDNCYIESSPSNDRLVYLARAEVRKFLEEAMRCDPRPAEIGFTGGEPFLNRDLLGMVEDSLEAGFRVLILTNAMKPMQRWKTRLLDIERRFPHRITIRVSVDHFQPSRHEELRGPHTWRSTIDGLRWLSACGFDIAAAGRLRWEDDESAMRAGYRRLFAMLAVPLDADDPSQLVLFPEMEADADVPEITDRCWGILKKDPNSVMCATSRMVIRRKGATYPTVVSCTLLPYEDQFELGATLAEAARPVKLNHRHCAKFCVLGGASCSAPK